MCMWRPATRGPEPRRTASSGNATFLRLPKLLDALDALPADRRVELELSGLRHTDHACAAELEGWAAQREARQAEGRRVRVGVRRMGGVKGR